MLLVTGATGFLGRSVLGALVRRPPEYREVIRVLVRDQRAVPSWWDVSIVEADILDSVAVNRAVRGCDRILHLAGLTHSSSSVQYHAVNVEGTWILVEAARRQGVGRFVFASTRAIGPAGGEYSVSKRTAEELIATSMKDFVIVRLAEVYGGRGGRGIADLITWMRHHRWVPVIGTGNYTLAPLHVDDAAAAMISALERGVAGQTYTVAGPENLTYNQLVDSVAQALHVRCLKLHVPIWLAATGARIAARRFPGRIACDQVARLVSPKPAMEPETPMLLGLTFRKFSNELPNLVARSRPRETMGHPGRVCPASTSAPGDHDPEAKT